jgi:hypothetical protein
VKVACVIQNYHDLAFCMSPSHMITKCADTSYTDIFCRVTKLRDACILLARSRPYREHPTDWVIRHLEKTGLHVLDVATFPRKYNYGKIKL